MTLTALHVIGARPNIPKFIPVWESLNQLGLTQAWVNTGQHFSPRMFEEIAAEFELAAPLENLGLNSTSRNEFMYKTIKGLDLLIEKHKPKVGIVYGDVNSTLAAALAFHGKSIHLIHIESGLRSFDLSMPEEINRIMVDVLSDTWITSMPSATLNLQNEGKPREQIFELGNTMIDSLARTTRDINLNHDKDFLKLENPYALVTLHRASNVDDSKKLDLILRELDDLGRSIQLVFPIHPRTKKMITSEYRNITFLEPISYKPFIHLMKNSKFVLTDSGGIQEETTYLNIPCFTLRDNTERPETITHGSNQLINTSDIPSLHSATIRSSTETIPGWDGNAGKRIGQAIHSILEELT
jgi:UDP-N-acetylglucosamine 2-epimerase (non-hydrolysing)